LFFQNFMKHRHYEIAKMIKSSFNWLFFKLYSFFQISLNAYPSSRLYRNTLLICTWLSRKEKSKKSKTQNQSINQSMGLSCVLRAHFDPGPNFLPMSSPVTFLQVTTKN
jgi:hypothetical protein